ncbi:MAG: methylmalonyl-CoA epimerase [Actinomycetota bacterium]|nr:methylmalonyl-CoA epimerase [Actinomycetota bacterium]
MSQPLHSNPPIPGIIGIDHLGIAVAELEAGIAFYQERFGGLLTHREINKEQGVEEAMVQVGSSMIQLLAPLDKNSPIARFLEKKGPGVQQVAYRVESVEAAMAAAKKLGMELLYPEPKNGTMGSKINFIHPRDGGGILIELVEIKKS